MHLDKRTRIIPCTVIAILTAAVSLAAAQHPQQQRPPATPKANERTIRGVWRTVVTPRNCQTGEALPSLPGLFTFSRGGTMSEYGIGPGSSPALRSPGHGVWKREHGWQDYSFAFTYYRYNASGVFLGSQRVSAALELAGNGDEFASRSAIAIMDVTGTVIGTGCATAVGTRFE
jgi:hypothetical protein